MTTLIKYANILDGSGKQAYKGDIFIRNNVISAIGNLSRQSADQTINAAGLYAAPGFIDLNTDSDHHLTLFSNPEQQDFLFQGVTTIAGGLCGASLAPLIYGGLESVKGWTNTREINVDWHTTGEFFRVLKRGGLGLNFSTFAGHTTIRQAITGEVARDLTLGELEVFEKIAADSIEQGSLGLSFGLGYIHGQGVPYSELKSLSRIVARKKGIIAVHLRNETSRLVESVKEVINLASETGVNGIISHLRPIKGFEVEFEEALEVFSQNSQNGEIHFDASPFDSSHVAIHTLLPEWARKGSYAGLLKNLQDKSFRKKVVSELKRMDIGDIRVATAGEATFLIGKTLKEFSEIRDLDIYDGLLSLMEFTKLRATVLYKNIDLPMLKKALSHERAVMASNSASFPPGMASLINKEKPMVKFLDLVLKEKLMPLEKAVNKLTLLPAKIIGLKKRGLIKQGNFADITLFSGDYGLGAEIKHVFVNGKLALGDGKLTGGRNGVVG